MPCSTADVHRSNRSKGLDDRSVNDSGVKHERRRLMPEARLYRSLVGGRRILAAENGREMAGMATKSMATQHAGELTAPETWASSHAALGSNRLCNPPGKLSRRTDVFKVKIRGCGCDAQGTSKNSEHRIPNFTTDGAWSKNPVDSRIGSKCIVTRDNCHLSQQYTATS